MKQKPDTKWQGSWAQQEKDRPKQDNLSAHWGKPNILIPGFDKMISLGPIDPKYARIFNG